ncbi:hypothetical protein ABT084_17725 [Streptomyces sp. NPDC002138]|uniref:hypothetical protein n=1 Tax=Streptomyces sp. NPDC002138 TaxID=3154410 RepID=UPI00332E3948
MLSVRREPAGPTLRVERDRTDAVLFTALRHGWSVVRVAEVPEVAEVGQVAGDGRRTPPPYTATDGAPR